MDSSRINPRAPVPWQLNALVTGAGALVGPWLTWWHHQLMSTPGAWSQLGWTRMNGQMCATVAVLSAALAVLIAVTWLRGRAGLLINPGMSLLWGMTAVFVGWIATAGLDPAVPGCRPEHSCYFEFGAVFWMLLTLVHWAALTGVLAVVVLREQHRGRVSAAE